MNFQHRDYQRGIFGFALDNARANIFSGMGTGKTPSMLSVVDALQLTGEAKRVLVLAPLRVAASTWPNEVKKWANFQHLTVAVACGPAAQRRAAVLSGATITCMNYENVPWLVEEFGKAWPFDMVIADESTKLKNQASKRFKALRKILPKTKRWVNLSGTPAPNGLLDLWAPQFCVDQGAALGRSMTAYKDRFFESDYMGYSFTPKAFAQEQIQERIAPSCITIEATDYFDLPPLVRNTLFVELPKDARETYKQLQAEMFAQLAEQTVEVFNAAALTNKCLQLANGAVYVGEDSKQWEEVHDAKIKALESVIEEAAGMPVLVAYHFTSDLARLRKAFPRGRHLDSDPKTIADWNAGKIPLLLAHPASAGHGLNLQDGGNILAFFGLNWNLEEHAQIIERIGPTRQAQAGHNRPVYVHYIVAKQTVDELVLARLETKRDVQQVLLDAMKQKGL